MSAGVVIRTNDIVSNLLQEVVGMENIPDTDKMVLDALHLIVRREPNVTTHQLIKQHMSDTYLNRNYNPQDLVIYRTTFIDLVERLHVRMVYLNLINLFHDRGWYECQIKGILHNDIVVTPRGPSV